MEITRIGSDEMAILTFVFPSQRFDPLTFWPNIAGETEIGREKKLVSEIPFQIPLTKKRAIINKTKTKKNLAFPFFFADRNLLFLTFIAKIPQI